MRRGQIARYTVHMAIMQGHDELVHVVVVETYAGTVEGRDPICYTRHGGVNPRARGRKVTCLACVVAGARA